MFKKSTLISIFLAFFSYLLFIYKIDSSTIYHSDFARDLYEILKISQGNLTLLGPKLSFGGLYTAPYYFYLYVPVFILTGFNLFSIPVFNAFLFSLAIGYFSKKTVEKYGPLKGILATILISTTTLIIFASRNPNNGSAYLSFLLMLLTYIYFEDINHWLKLLAIGFIFGVLVNFSFSNVVLLPSLLILFMYKLKDRKKVLFFIPGFIAAFLPILLFELKHNFIQIRNTFALRSYRAWIENRNVSKESAGPLVSKNLIENLLYVAQEIKPFIGFNPLIAFFVFLATYFLNKGKKYNLFLLTNSLLALIVLSGFVRFQFAIHYVYAVAFFIFFNLVIFILETRLSFFLVIIMVLSGYNFPIHLFKTSNITYQPFEKAVQYSIDKKLIDKGSRFNLVHIAHPNAILGYEYRYFFQKNGFAPTSEFEYANSDILLIFTERKNFNPLEFKTWEVEQFGLKYLKNAQKYKVGKIFIFKAQRK